jgi:hypothetical protein
MQLAAGACAHPTGRDRVSSAASCPVAWGLAAPPEPLYLPTSGTCATTTSPPISPGARSSG